MLEIFLAGTRENVEQALQKYERAIAAILKSSLDRDWKDEDLDAVAQIAANAITWRDREIKQLKEDVCVLAEKVREVLGEPKAERVYEPVEPKPAEKWVVECQRNTAWARSQDVPGDFSSEAEARQGIADAKKCFGIVLSRRARRID